MQQVCCSYGLPKQVLLQALARGYLARSEFRRRVAERKAVEEGALAVIRPWARTAVARLHFLRLRCALGWTESPFWPLPGITNSLR